MRQQSSRSIGNRIVRILAVAAVGLAVLGVCLNITLKRMLMIEPIKNLLAKKMERELGRKLTVGSLSVTLFGGVSARYVRIHDRAEFGPEPLFKARLIRAKVKIVPLLRGELVIGGIDVLEPVVTIQWNKAGEVNIAELLFRREESRPAVDDTVRRNFAQFHASLQKKPLNIEFATKSFVIEKIRVYNGAVRIVNRESGVTEDITGFDIELRANIESDVINISKLDIRLPPAKLTAVGKVSKDLSMAELMLTADPTNFMEMRNRISAMKVFTGGTLRVSKFLATVKLDHGVVTIPDLSFSANAGSVAARFQMDTSTQPWSFSTEFQARRVKLDSFLWETRSDELSFGGTLTMRGYLTGRGFGQENLTKSLQGKVSLIVRNGRFKNAVFMAIDDLVMNVLGTSILRDFRSEATGSFVVRKGEGRFATRDLRFVSDLAVIYTAEEGHFGIDGSIDFPKAVVRVGDQELPLKIGGTIHDPKIKPDLKSFGRKLLKDFLE